MKRKEKLLSIFMVLFAMISVNAYAGTGGNSKTYYSKVNVEAKGNGKVYVKLNDNTSPSDSYYKSTAEAKNSSSSSTNDTYYLFAKPDDNNIFAGWYTNTECTEGRLANSWVSIQQKENESDATQTYYAKFIDYSSASLTNPLDFTDVIINPGAETGNTNGWTTDAGVLNNNGHAHLGTYQFETAGWGKNEGSMTQTISNLPNGYYKVSVWYIAATETDVTLTANDVSTTPVRGIGDSHYNQLTTEMFHVSNGVITITASSSTKAEENWSNFDDFTLTYYGPAGEETIKLNAYGYATFSRAYAAEITGAGVYTAKINNGSIYCYKVEDGVVPAGVGVLLYGEPNTEVTITPKETDKTYLNNNELQASTLANGSLAEVPESGAYTLSGDTFKTYSKTEFVHGKAYFVKPDMIMGGVGETKVFSFEFAESDEATAISTVKANVEGVAYNLAGQRVAPTTKGIVIINGKKYFNK